MRIEAKRTKGSIHAVQAIHIAFTFVRIHVDLAVNKEAWLKKRTQPWRPLVFFIRTIIEITSSSSLYRYIKKKKENFQYKFKGKKGKIPMNDKCERSVLSIGGSLLPWFFCFWVWYLLWGVVDHLWPVLEAEKRAFFFFVYTFFL